LASYHAESFYSNTFIKEKINYIHHRIDEGTDYQIRAIGASLKVRGAQKIVNEKLKE